MTAPFTPYSTLRPMMPATKPSWIVNELDQQRILSYQLYEQIYWNVPDTFKLVFRGTEDKPVYLPSGKTIIETVNRFTATGMKILVQGQAGAAETVDDATRLAYQLVWNNLFKRERFWAKFAGNKRYGLIRGDWLWYLTANPLKPQGSRLKIRPLDPASYFPIWDDDDVDLIIGCHIVETLTDAKGDTYVHKTTYRKGLTELNPGPFISVEEGNFKLDEWEGPKDKPTKIIKPLQPIPGITNLPVYHIPNFDEPANPFGSSEMRGLERVIAAMNQAVSDEELALALEGLGQYWTDAPPPTDDGGEEVPWILGPGRVIEIPPGSTFNRTSGVSSVSSSQEHIRFLEAKMRESASTPDIAIGSVDVSTAESGIALAIKMAPLLAHTAEKDVSVVGVHDQMFYDIANEWLPTFEQTALPAGVEVIAQVGDKVPTDRAARLQELNDMLDRGVISRKYYRTEAAKLGYVFDENALESEIADDDARNAELADPFGARVASEAQAGVDGDGQTQ
jgi:hypothetical protein